MTKFLGEHIPEDVPNEIKIEALVLLFELGGWAEDKLLAVSRGQDIDSIELPTGGPQLDGMSIDEAAARAKLLRSGVHAKVVQVRKDRARAEQLAAHIAGVALRLLVGAAGGGGLRLETETKLEAQRDRDKEMFQLRRLIDR